jgi:hypothetical protein
MVRHYTRQQQTRNRTEEESNRDYPILSFRKERVLFIPPVPSQKSKEWGRLVLAGVEALGKGSNWLAGE